MKSLQSWGILAALLLLTTFIVTGVHYFAGKYLDNLSTKRTNYCHTQGVKYIVVVQDEKVIPHHTEARLCDTITIKNLDPTERLVAFGPHSNHISYDGVSERLLAQGQSLTVTLNQPGTFLFHDHIDAVVSGNFTVTQ